MSTILIFEDDPEERERVTEGLRKACAGGKVRVFSSDGGPEEGKSFETHIRSWIDEHLSDENIALIVSDKELGRYEKCRGLSATAVSQVALQKGLPFCQYSRQPDMSNQEIAEFNRLRQWNSQEITLEGLDSDAWVPQAAALFNGFERIRTKYVELDVKRSTPASALASILDHPASESRIALYGSGKEGFLKEILTFYDPEKPNIDLLRKRMPRILGNWLYLSILRFPGLLVNLVAAASYLNIDPVGFKQENVLKLFATAKYTGPFSDLSPWWWRDKLDVLLGEAECEDGHEFVKNKGIEVSECLDPQSKKRAGYYCMLTQKPVSAENSRGGISWFPSGADLARMKKDKFEQITALVGMY